jgi:hypothetical protein
MPPRAPRRLAAQPTIAWDVDDVLNDLMRAWFDEAFRAEHPETTATYESLTHNPPHEVLGITLGDYLESLDAFRAKRQMTLAPDEAVLKWFARRGDHCRHIAVTATPMRNAHRSAAWVLQHFGRWIRTVTILPSAREGEQLPIYDATKVDALSRLREVAVLIDDTPKNMHGIERAGAIGILVPRPWNGLPGGIDAALAQLDARLDA